MIPKNENASEAENQPLDGEGSGVSTCSIISIPTEEYEELKKDKARLDYLERAHNALSARYQTAYGWKLVINQNVVRAMVKNCHPWDGKDGVDLHDSQAGHEKCNTCRDAIDKVILSNVKNNRSQNDAANQ